jgi:hypothetical protein
MPAIDRDTGLGTTYERIAVARLLDTLADRYTPERVLEGPTDGITGIRGINSVPLAQRGATVELLLSDPDEVALANRIWSGLGLSSSVTIRESTDFRLDVPERSFDLVWNFNSLPQVPDPVRLIHDMCKASRHYVLVFVSNTWNYGFPVHRLHHTVSGETWSHGDIAMMNTRRIERMVAEHGFVARERLLVDVPWWPDIDSPIEEVAATFLPFLKRRLAKGSKRLEQYTWRAEELPYFDRDKSSRLLNDLGRHFAIERTRRFPFRSLFAHHRGVLAERGLE